MRKNKQEQSKKGQEHLDMIGWLITSFFLIFLGTILPALIIWGNNPDPNDGLLKVLIIISIIFFGFLVSRLFLKCQYQISKEKPEDRFWTKPSIIFYLIFISLIEFILLVILSKFIGFPAATIVVFSIFITLIIVDRVLKN